LFQRFFKDDNPKYRAFLDVAAVCAIVRDDISNRSSATGDELSRMRAFLDKAISVLENSPNAFYSAYLHAFSAIADTLLDVEQDRGDSDISQKMFTKVSGMAFHSLYKRVLMRIDSDQARAADLCGDAPRK
jgi:hypothetical protein